MTRSDTRASRVVGAGERVAVTPEELIGRAHDLVPALADRAAAAEQARCVPAENIAALRAAGLFRVLQPERYGGYEHDFATYIRIVFALAQGCAATAWVYAAAAMHQWQIGMFRPAVQDEVWGDDFGTLAAASVAPAGLAVAVEGGWRVSGTWRFASGCDHAGWFLLGVRTAPAPGAEPAGQGFVLVPREACTIEDDWHALGLQGTGSKRVVIIDALMPVHRHLDLEQVQSGAPPGAAVNAGPLFRIPLLAALATSTSAPTVGAAAATFEEYVATTRDRVTRGAALGAAKSVAAFPTIQVRVAEASACVDAAKLVLLTNADALSTAVAAGRAPSSDDRLRYRRDHAFAVRLAVQAADRMFEAVGGQGLFSANRVQRGWRDVHAAAMHASLDWDAAATLYGRVKLGLPPEDAQI